MSLDEVQKNWLWRYRKKTAPVAAVIWLVSSNLLGYRIVSGFLAEIVFAAVVVTFFFLVGLFLTWIYLSRAPKH